MKIDNNCLIEVSITKGNLQNNSNTGWEVRRMTPETLLQLVRQGYNWSNVFSDLSCEYKMKKDTFISSNCIVIDTYNDKTKEELINASQQPDFLKPTFFYPHPVKDSIKLVYCFREKLTPLNYATVYDNVWKRVGVSQDMNHRAGNGMMQKNKGNTNDSVMCSLSNIIYDIEDFSCSNTQELPF